MRTNVLIDTEYISADSRDSARLRHERLVEGLRRLVEMNFGNTNARIDITSYFGPIGYPTCDEIVLEQSAVLWTVDDA